MKKDMNVYQKKWNALEAKGLPWYRILQQLLANYSGFSFTGHKLMKGTRIVSGKWNRPHKAPVIAALNSIKPKLFLDTRGLCKQESILYCLFDALKFEEKGAIKEDEDLGLILKILYTKKRITHDEFQALLMVGEVGMETKMANPFYDSNDLFTGDFLKIKSSFPHTPETVAIEVPMVAKCVSPNKMELDFSSQYLKDHLVNNYLYAAYSRLAQKSPFKQAFNYFLGRRVCIPQMSPIASVKKMSFARNFLQSFVSAELIIEFVSNVFVNTAHLDLSFNYIKTLPVLKSFPASLIKLNLSNNLIVDDGLMPLLGVLTNSQHNALKTLDLANNELTDNVVDDLIKMLEANPQLHSIDLQGNQFSPEKIAKIEDEISHHTTLNEKIHILAQSARGSGYFFNVPVDVTLKILGYSVGRDHASEAPEDEAFKKKMSEHFNNCYQFKK